MSRDQSTTAQDINLAYLLSIIWRRRLFVLGFMALGLVVGVLYGLFAERRWEATITIRPGVTSFAPDGTPVRQWRLRDISRWYENQLYKKDLLQRLGLPPGGMIDIKAEYISPGLHDYIGGEVITLWTMANAPDLAKAILDSSLSIFAEFSEMDTVGSQLKLTKDNLRLTIRRLQTQLQILDRDHLLLDLQVKAARAESLSIVAEDLKLAKDLERLKKQRLHIERRLTTLRAEEPRLMTDLDQLDSALLRLTTTASERDVQVDIPSWIRRDAVLDSGSILESLTRAKLLVHQALAHNRTRQDSLSYVFDVNHVESAKILIQRELVIWAMLQEAHRKIGELILDRDVELPSKREVVYTNIDDIFSRLGVLSPIQRIGSTVVSDQPVRPRPVRAVTILMSLGMAAGIVLGFVWDYIESNRQKIFRF